MFKMVIFDLDGTLLNTLEDLADAGNYALKCFGFPTHAIDKYRYFVGNGIPKLIERIVPENCENEAQIEVYEAFCSYYELHMNDNTRPYDGIIEMLESLKRKNIISIVVTNKADDFAGIIVKKYFGSLIEKTYGSIEGYPKKPDPYWVNKAIEDFGFDISEIVYVGDSGVDMQTAVNSGLYSCGVTWGFRDKEELIANGAEIICSDCNELKKIIIGL